MSLKETSKNPAPDERVAQRATVFDWGEVCASLTAEALAEQIAPSFFVGCGGGMLKTPEGPAATLLLSRALVEAAGRGEPVLLSPVFPIVRQQSSEFSFISVGRTANCDVCIPDESISKLHAIMRVTHEGTRIHDAGSANGCYVDGRKVSTERTQARLLRPGDSVRLGAVDLLYLNAAEFRFLVNHQMAMRPKPP